MPRAGTWRPAELPLWERRPALPRLATEHSAAMELPAESALRPAWMVERRRPRQVPRVGPHSPAARTDVQLSHWDPPAATANPTRLLVREMAE